MLLNEALSSESVGTRRVLACGTAPGDTEPVRYKLDYVRK
jgi:hypothetical protein